MKAVYIKYEKLFVTGIFIKFMKACASVKYELIMMCLLRMSTWTCYMRKPFMKFVWGGKHEKTV